MTNLLFASPAPLEQSAAEPSLGLFERLGRGEPHAVGEVYDAHHGAVRRFALRLLGDASAAEDLVHEVFVALPRAAQSFRGDASLRTLLMSIAVRRAHHHVRSAARRRAAFGRLEREPTRPVRDPEHEVGRKELAQALLRALDRLSVEQRIAFVLCEVEEKSSKDVAELVGVPEGTVRTRLFHAKRKLRAELEREGF